MTLSTAPALNGDDGVAIVEDAQLDGLSDTPLQATVDVFLPDGLGEVWFVFGEAEGVDATVEMGILRWSVEYFDRG